MSENKVTDQQLIQQIRQEYETKEASSSGFPTEVINLPSKGLLYEEGHPLSSGKVELKYMTAREEDILTTQSFIKNGTVVDKLLESLIISNGEGQAVKYAELLTVDKNAVMLAARIMGYGKDYEVEISDPTSDKKQKVTIDLTQFQAEEYDGSEQVELHKNEYRFKLPTSEREITFKALSESNERKIRHQLDELSKKNRKFKDDTNRELTTRLKNVITSVDGEYDQKVIDTFVDREFFSRDSIAFRKHMSTVLPKMDLSWIFVSDETGEEREMQLPIEINFFWPGA